MNTVNSEKQINDLEEERKKLNSIISDAQKQIAEAIVLHKQTGQYMEASKFMGLKTTVRENSYRLHEIARDIKKLSKANNKQYLFKVAAKQILETDVFDKVNDLAESLALEHK